MSRFLSAALGGMLVCGLAAAAEPRADTEPGRAQAAAKGAGPASSRVERNHASRVRRENNYGRLPMSFERNVGQADGRVRFLSRGKGYGLFLLPDEALLALEKSESKIKSQKSKVKNGRDSAESRVASAEKAKPGFLKLKFVGASPAAPVTGLDELSGKSNYFIGNDPSKWRRDVPTYARVKYTSVYPGVDLVYYGHQGRLEYDFVVAPGADPKAIRFRIETGNWEPETRESRFEELVRIDHDGDLVLGTEGGEVRFHKPVVYQTNSPLRIGAVGNPNSEIENRQLIEGRYALRASDLGSAIEVGFEIAAYDPSRPLVIDPVLSYSTYLGGSNADAGYGIAVDAAGSAYITGSTRSTNFPAATPEQAANGGDADVFVTKLNPTGTALVYSTYLGGAGFDKGAGIAVDSQGNAYVTGMTSSSNFPTTKGSFQTTYGGGSDAFVAKLNAAGSALVYSSYLGGSGDDFGQGIAVDASMSAYVTGSTDSTNFRLASALQGTIGGASDAFVAKVKADGTALTYSTYLGGTGPDSGQGIAVDSTGEAFVTGFTSSTNFPTMSPAQAANGGSADAFIAKLNAAGSALLYSTYLGGNGLDRGFAIALDTAGNAYVTGDTDSTNFTASAGAFQPLNAGGGDAFVTKLSASGGLVYFSFLGGSDLEQGTGIAVDTAENATVTGLTQSSNFPTADPLQANFGGGACGTTPCSDAFVTELNAQGSGLVYSTFLGGSGADFGQAVALDAAGDAYVTGSTASVNFPPTAGVVQAVFAGSGASGDAFVAKVAPTDAAAVALSPQAVAFGNQGTGAASPAQVVTLTNAGSIALNISSIAITGTNAADFALAALPSTVTLPPCPPSGPLAAAGGACAFAITFTPSAKAAETASLAIMDDATGGPPGPHLVSLAGTGVTPTPAATLSAATLTFNPQPFGVASTPQQVTLTNTGSAALNITKIAISGDFTETDTCSSTPPSTTAPAILNPGASCTFSIVFTPAGAGSTARTGSLAITDNATGSPHSVALSGTGIAVFSLSAPTASTSTVTIGSKSTTFTVAASAPSSFTGSLTLACTITSGAICTFNPTSIKSSQTSMVTVSGLVATTANPLIFTVNGTSGTQTASVSLRVVLADFAVTASPGLDTIAAGQNAVYTISVSSTNGFNQAVALSCAGTLPLAQGLTCSFSPASVTPTGTTAGTATLTVKTTAQTITAPRSTPRQVPPAGPRGILGLFAILALGAAAVLRTCRLAPEGAMPARNPIPLSRLALAATTLFLALAAACSNNFGVGPIVPGGISGTAPGNYSLIITGTLKGNSTTSTDVPRSTSVNLAVG